MEKELGKVLALIDGNKSLASILKTTDGEKRRLEIQVGTQSTIN